MEDNLCFCCLTYNINHCKRYAKQHELRWLLSESITPVVNIVATVYKKFDIQRAREE